MPINPRVPAVLIVLVLVGQAGGAETKPSPAGVDLFVEACHWAGVNPAMIRSGHAKFELTSTSNSSPEALQRELDQTIESQRQLLKTETRPEYRAAIEDNIKQLPRTLTAHRSGQKKSRVEVLFDGNDKTFGKRRYSVSNFNAVTKQWDRPIIVLSRDTTKAGSDSIVYYDMATTARLSKDHHGMEEFQVFGRIQGVASMLATAILLKGGDPERFDFPPENVAAFKAQIAQMARGGQPGVFKVTREVEYEKGATAFEVETRIMDKPGSPGKVMKSYWIDPARGYICPRIQLHDEASGQLALEYTASDYFLHEESGLWFPALFVSTAFVIGTDTVSERKEFKFDKESFQLNQPVAPEEFVIQLPEKTNVIDSRLSPEKNYRTLKAVELSFMAPKSDLASINGIGSVDASPIRTAMGSRPLIFIINCVAVLLVIIAILWRRRWQQRVRRAAPLLLFACVLVSGCSGANGDVGRLSIEPAVVDFGRARETDGPLKLSFTIVNPGATPVAIRDVRSGCGCTVAELTQTVIPPHTRVPVPVRVDLRGRSGKFSNAVWVWLPTAGEKLEVPITGTIVKDLWYDGQVVRCSVDDSSPRAQGTFTVSTVDWPSVQFDWSGLDKDVSIQEVSRLEEAGETQIKFAFTVTIAPEAPELVKTVVLKPRNERINPLLIPIACFRSRVAQQTASTNAIRPERVSLGAIRRGEEQRFRFFGLSALVGSLVVAGSEGLPEGSEVTLLPSDSAEAPTRSVVLQVGPSAPLGLFHARVRFKSPDGREYSIAVLGQVNGESS